MKIKNITQSDKELLDITGQRISVGPGKTIELERASFNKNSFKILEKEQKNTNIEQNMTKVDKKSTEEKINIEKEVI